MSPGQCCVLIDRSPGIASVLVVPCVAVNDGMNR
jgi:hypothetical protein